MEIGEKAGVVVNAVECKTASAHDLRRLFASRWAKRVAPAILQELMRHASIQTMMGFYVDLDVDEMADELWANHHPADVKTGLLATLLATTGRKRPRNQKAQQTTVKLTNPPWLQERMDSGLKGKSGDAASVWVKVAPMAT